MKTTWIVTYDICEAKRLRKVFETCKQFGMHLQYSVFECDLDPRQRVDMERQLTEIIHHQQDQVLFIELGPTEGRGDRAISAIGLPYARIDAACYVI